MEMAEAKTSQPTSRKIGLRATSRGAAGVATITRISYSEDEDGRGPVDARISVRYGPKPKKDRKGMTIGPWPETSDLVVPASVAQKLAVGMQCRVSLEPVGSHRKGQDGY